MCRGINNSCTEIQIKGLVYTPERDNHMGDKKKKIEEKGYPEVSSYVTTQSHGDIQCNKK